MERRIIVYPNGETHEVEVKEYNHSDSINLDYIEFYDYNKDVSSFLILDNFKAIFDNENIINISYQELTEKITPKDIKELPEVIEAKKETKKTRLQMLNPDTTSINDKREMTNEGLINSRVEEKPPIELQVMYDSTNNYYIPDNIAKELNIGSGTYYINGIKSKLTSSEQIESFKKALEDYNMKNNLKIVPKYIEKKKKKITIELYKDTNTDKVYIRKEDSEKINIDKYNVNYIYWIDDQEYLELDSKAIEKLYTENKVEIKFKPLPLQQSVIQEFIVYVDEAANRYYIEEDASNILGIGRGIFIIGDKKCKEVTKQEIEEVENTSKFNVVNYKAKYVTLQFHNIHGLNINLEDITITDVYKDVNNNDKLWLKKEDCNKYHIGDTDSFKYINNQECYQISREEMSQIENPVERTVYLQEEVKFELRSSFIACKYENHYYIDSDLAKKYNIESKTSISVDGKTHVSVELNDIKNIESQGNLEAKIVNIKPIQSVYNDLDDMFNNQEPNINDLLNGEKRK